MKNWLIISLLLTVSSVYAESNKPAKDEDEMTMTEMLKVDKDLKVNKEEIRKSLQMLKAKGQISESDYMKALNDLNGMDDKKIEEMNNKAQDLIKANPNAAEATSKKQLSSP